MAPQSDSSSSATPSAAASPRSASSYSFSYSYSPAPSSRGVPSEASSYSSMPTPSGYSSSSAANTPRDGLSLPQPLVAAAGALRSALVAADNAFGWLVDPSEHEHRVSLKRVPPPPRPERLERPAVPPRPLCGSAALTAAQPSAEDGALLVPQPLGGRGAHLEWREIGELRGALSDNEAALQSGMAGADHGPTLGGRAASTRGTSWTLSRNAAVLLMLSRNLGGRWQAAVA